VRSAALVKDACATVLAPLATYDRCEPNVDLGVPNIALAEYRAPENYRAADYRLCTKKVPITRF
jgi:hypothetical protein